MSTRPRQRHSKRGALSNTVWTIIGIAVALVMASLVYTFTMRGVAGVAQLTVKGIQISSSRLVAEIRNIGMGNVKIEKILVLDENGNNIRCTLTTVKKDDLTTKLPVLLRSSDILTAYFSGRECQDAATIIVETNAGIFKGTVVS